MFADVGFEHAVTGFEVSGTMPDEAGDTLGLLTTGGGRLVERTVRRWDGYGLC